MSAARILWRWQHETQRPVASFLGNGPLGKPLRACLLHQGARQTKPLCAQLQAIAGQIIHAAKQAGMGGDAAKGPGVVIVYLALQTLVAPGAQLGGGILVYRAQRQVINMHGQAALGIGLGSQVAPNLEQIFAMQGFEYEAQQHEAQV